MEQTRALKPVPELTRQGLQDRRDSLCLCASSADGSDGETPGFKEPFPCCGTNPGLGRLLYHLPYEWIAVSLLSL